MTDGSKDQLYELLKTIVAKEFPDELAVAEAVGKDLLSRSLTVSSQEKLYERRRLPIEFGDGIVEAMKFVSLLWGTVQAVRGLSTTTFDFRRDRSEELQARWCTELALAGLDRESAERISSAFVADLAQSA